ncbi:hypothetical protein EV13_1306 [Prochlorococcus sp. MIT 0702]|nr:hypothetical protein EV13_1306 [Prochlorococcus sp. MIT 0702]
MNPWYNTFARAWSSRSTFEPANRQAALSITSAAQSSLDDSAAMKDQQLAKVIATKKTKCSLE